MFGAYGALGALHERERTGCGKVVRTSLLAAVVAVHSWQGTRWLIGGERPEAIGNRHPTVAPYGAFQCEDGIVQVGVGNDTLWARFAPLVGLDPEDERFRTNEDRVRRYPELEQVLGEAFAQETIAEWLERCADAGVPAGEVKPLDRVYEWPQVLSQGLVVETEHATLGPIRLPGPPLRFDGEAALEHMPPPTLGEHSDAIRAWLDERERE
jgi:crotonobetainyl-CoA:carnitine CoA-transferase CaiB-like acyl-CoA transferase